MLEMRHKFNPNTETREDWVEPGQKLQIELKAKEGTAEGDQLRKQLAFARTMFNRSSVSHNIINLKDRPASKATNDVQTIFNRKLHNHKKSISDFFETGF